MTILIRAYRREDLGELIQLFTDSVHRVACRNYGPDQIAAWGLAAVNREQ
ncbi:hypothetical protein KOAAANKH_02032 [Brevundimonas sp. NIBR10]|nr:hypothetical protein [Brevundimonas sp. NIBR10]WGM47157.1 hypothetical protein KOAAANKH_02032 [Brevundimonas sp. NIBR10]